MEIHLAYGKTGLSIHLPAGWDVTVVEPRQLPGIADPQEALRQVLRHPLNAPPLRELAASARQVGIVFSDITRPTPNHLLLPAILAELAQDSEKQGISDENITLFNALGTHRTNTAAELSLMLGERRSLPSQIVDRFRIVQNNAFDPATQVCLGRTQRGHEIWLNREIMECELKILTGFIEPHFFAGFSGGGKALMPGMAGQRTVLGNHDAGMIAHPKATWGITHGNPIFEEISEVAQQAGELFLLNVTLNKDKQITGIFAGDLEAAHASGCNFVRQTAMAAVPQLFDIVVTTNSGYPLDLNLYQAVKGMSAAAQVVRPGGTILAAAECWDGIPDHGLYAQLLRQAESPRALLERVCTPGFLEQDQWQVQIQAQILLKAEVYLYSHNLSDEQIKACLLKPCRDIAETLADLLARYSPQAKICVLPEGPQTNPYLQE